MYFTLLWRSEVETLYIEMHFYTSKLTPTRTATSPLAIKKKKITKILSSHNHLLAVAASSLYPPDIWGPAFVRSLPTLAFLFSRRAFPPPTPSFRRGEMLSLYFGRQQFFILPQHKHIYAVSSPMSFNATNTLSPLYSLYTRFYIL